LATSSLETNPPRRATLFILTPRQCEIPVVAPAGLLLAAMLVDCLDASRFVSS
jgi:hypothetical protein